jgi:hypothetical protein
MGRERCWRCHKLSSDVELRACDDRLCESCFQKNEAELAANHRRANGNAASASSSASRRTSMASSAAGTKQGPNRSAVSSVLTPKSPTVAAADAVNETAVTSLQQIQQSDTQASDQNEQSPVRNLQQETLTGATSAGLSNDNDQISQLRSIVHQQQVTINLLTEQLKFVMSILGIDAPAQQLADDGNKTHGHSDHATVSGENGALIAESNQETQSSLSWTDVVRKRSDTRQHQQLTNLQQTLVAAVYSDQIDKKRRESSLIISGLQPDSCASDKSLVIKLCRNEFGFQPDITMVKRIGHRQTGKIQPLLVAVRQVDQAQQLIGNARQLRKSPDSDVRDHVYINANLTRAEGEAAYRARQQRRQAFQKRADRQRQRSGEQLTLNQQNDDIPSMQLNPLAGEFNLPNAMPVNTD